MVIEVVNQMFKIILISILITVSFSSRVFAENGNDVIKEYTESEVHYNFNNPDVRDPEAVLKENVLNAVKTSIQRHFPDNKSLIQGFDPERVKYEQVLGTRIVIVKFEDLVFEFRYTANPRRYLLSPVHYKFYKTQGKDKNQTELNSSGG
jgi:hypothetical protein